MIFIESIESASFDRAKNNECHVSSINFIGVIQTKQNKIISWLLIVMGKFRNETYSKRRIDDLFSIRLFSRFIVTNRLNNEMYIAKQYHWMMIKTK